MMREAVRAAKHILYAFGVAALLAGCGDGDVQEVRDWMKQVITGSVAAGSRAERS